MENENLLMEVKPSAVVLIPHFCLMLVFVGFITIWKPLFGIISTNIRVTNKRVSAKKGIIKTESLDSPIDKITSVKVEQKLFGKIFNYGTIYINTASGDYTFEYIPNVEQLRDVIIKNASK